MNQPAIEIRPCRIEDISEVLALWVRAGAVPSPTDDSAALAQRLERDPELFVIATADSQVVGSLMGGWDGWRGNMYRMAIDPQYRRLGLAGRLVETVETGLRRLGCSRITSLVFKNEEGAVPFWLSTGYFKDDAIDRYAKDLV
ncbi:MAG: GNAT family N-acetyltransferase [Dehalococcoidia bacterium]